MPEPWNLELLGTLRLSRGETTITRFHRPNVGFLLAYLACFPQRSHSREDLVDALWPQSAPTDALRRLTQVLVWLRRELEAPLDLAPGSVVVATRASVRLNPDLIRVDAARFEAALRASRRAELPLDERIRALREDALPLYHGDFLPGAQEDWALEQRRTLAEGRITGLERLSALYRARNQGDDLERAAEVSRTAVAADPTREEAHLELMRALSASGQNAAALRQYHALERVLAESLDERPSSEAGALAERIRSLAQSQPRPKAGAGESVSVEQSAPSTAAATTGWSMPPAPITRFFGREEELAQISSHVRRDGARLVTLLGAGGSGKTRLGIEAAHRLSAAFDGAVAYVPFADLNDAALIPNALGDALVVERGGGPAVDLLEGVARALRSVPKALLILDNVEHLSPGAARPIRTLLEKVPGLTVLATSRQRLGVEGERLLPVPPLPLPSAETLSEPRPDLGVLTASPSVRLFEDRTQAVRPSFRLTDANVATVAALCRRLEGMPLAIELCAAWSEVLTPSQMLQQVEDRFNLLVSRRTDLPNRHRTLRAAIEYSFVLLPADLRDPFLSLSVFRGGWTIEAAAAVIRLPSSATMDVLLRLRERSLILSEETASDDALRFRMLETLREFGAEKRAATEATGQPSGVPDDPGHTADAVASTSRRHFAYYLYLAETAEPHLLGLNAPKFLTLLETEHDNLRAALQWACDSSALREGRRLAYALWRFWEIRGYAREGLEWIRRLIPSEISSRIHAGDVEGDTAGPGEEKDARAWLARAQFAQARLLNALGDFPQARASAEAALMGFAWSVDAADRRQTVLSRHVLGIIEGRMGNLETARRLHQEALTEAKDLHDPFLIGINLCDMGTILVRQGCPEAAYDAFQESLVQFRQAGLKKLEANALSSLGNITALRGDYVQADDFFRQSCEIGRLMQDRQTVSISLLHLATGLRMRSRGVEEKALRQSIRDEARRLLHEALGLTRQTGSKYVLTFLLMETGVLALDEGRYREGARLLGMCEGLARTANLRVDSAHRDGDTSERAVAREQIGAEEFAALWRAGTEMSPDEMIAEALQFTAPAISSESPL